MRRKKTTTTQLIEFGMKLSRTLNDDGTKTKTTTTTING